MKNNINSIRQNILMKSVVIILITAFVIITQTGCGDKDSVSEPISKNAFCLNTSCDISVYDKSGKEAEEILEGAFDEIDKYENMFSKTVSDSDTSLVNNSGGKPAKVSEDTYEVIKMALDISRLSDGKFDITVGRLTELWDFQSDDPKLPEDRSIEEALKTVGYDNVSLGDDFTVTLSDADAKLDLGGIAKGYIADRITEYLEQQGVKSALINLGGNVVAVGSKPDGTSWNIGIERPYSDRTELIGSVKVSDTTVVTSGIYERMFVEDGKLYHHVLDPKTGYPAETDLEAVTITGKKGYSAYCDGLSTSCLMLGKEKAIALVEKLQQEMPEAGFEASFIDKDDNVTKTDGMVIESVN